MSIKKSIMIACVSINKNGGIETYIRDQAFGYREKGWEVSILTTNFKGDYYEYMATYFNCFDLSNLKSIFDKVSESVKIINFINPSILICNHVSIIHYCLPRLNQNIKPLVILHSDDDIFYRDSLLMKTWVWRWICPTPGLFNTLKNRLPENLHYRILLIPHGVNPNKFKPAIDKKWDEVHYSLVFCGSFLPHKGINLLPQIFSKLIKFNPNLKLNIVGSGSWQEKIQAEFTLLGINDSIYWHGYLPQDSIIKILHKCDILLFPTRLEGFGLVIIEAMLCGVLPVVTKLDGITDSILTDNKTGILVEKDNINEFVNKIIQLYLHPKNLEQLKKNSFQDAVNKYSSDKMLDNYLKIFKIPDDRRIKPYKYKISWIIFILIEYIKKKYFTKKFD